MFQVSLFTPHIACMDRQGDRGWATLTCFYILISNNNNNNSKYSGTEFIWIRWAFFNCIFDAHPTEPPCLYPITNNNKSMITPHFTRHTLNDEIYFLFLRVKTQRMEG